MLRPPRPVSSACAAGLVALAVAGWGCPTARADTGDGTITVVVDRDVNGNGTFDESVDTPQSGIKVTITDVSGHEVSDTTGEDGRYVVKASDTLVGGRYFVVADIPDDLGLQPAPASDSFQPLSTTVDVSAGDQTVRLGVVARAEPSPTPATDSPEAPTATATATEEAPPPPPAPAPTTTTSRPQASAAAPRFAVGDTVWQDSNRQGVQDDEAGAGRTSVQLLDASGTVLDSTVTQDGHYSFDDLPAGVYSVRFSGIEQGWRLSPTGAGEDPARDSDPDFTGVTPPFTLDVGAPEVRPATGSDHVRADYINPTIDAGLAPLRYAVGSSVWQDLNGDGIQQPSEPASQARVLLLDAASGVQVAAVTTDAQGHYLFDGLPQGSYRLHFTDLGNHRQLTAAHVGSNAAVDSDPDPRTRSTKTFALVPTSADLVPARDFGPVNADFVDAALNAGVIGSYTIANRVWRDSNGDGLFSPGEQGIAGITVQVLDAAKAVVASTTTSGTGRYAFTSLPAGQYQLRFRHVPAGLHFTTTGAGSDPGSDSDVYLDAMTAPITVGEGHPAETAVGAGLTSVEAARATDTAPRTTAAAATTATPALGGTGGVGLGLPALAAGLLVAGGTVLLVARRRRSQA